MVVQDEGRAVLSASTNTTLDPNKNYHISQVEPSNRRHSSIYIPSSRLHLHSLVLPYQIHSQYPELSQHHLTYTKQRLSYQNTLSYLHNFVRILCGSVCFIQPCHTATASDVDPPSTRSDAVIRRLQRKAKGNCYGTMPTAVINRCLLLDCDHIVGIILEHVRGFIQINKVCSFKDQYAWDLFYDIIILDPVTTHHVSHFRLMWQHRRSSRLPVWEWWAAFHSYMVQMFYSTHNQMNIWRWNNPRSFEDYVDHSNLKITSSGKVKHTNDHFSWYGRDDLSAVI